eukprot:TRINITY_DN1276_c0_g1_i8.p1 TRINITY_DN1276_c0_g1~~TRINITY_DN1276_c0_g1_i8.p1  ORF type:complete len:551 (-),score=70.20 TRINITY_DN1276_c0_g1_i8:351-2003(-)
MCIRDRYYGHWVDGNEMGIVMEYCGAGAVNELMKVEGRDVELPEEIIKVVCWHVLRGLGWLHRHRKIHRDVKGCNVLLTEDGQAKLADFGISAKMSTIAGNRQTVIGTPFWMAPEVIGSEENADFGYDCKADIWSLGITALEMAETRPPYADKHYMKAMLLIHQNEPPGLKHPRKWSADFKDFLERCLKKDTAERASAAELLEHPFITTVNEAALRDFILAEWGNIVARRNVGRTSPESYGSDYDLDDGTEIFHERTKKEDSPGTAVFHEDDSGTAVFYGGGGADESGTAVFHGGNDDQPSSAIHSGQPEQLGTAVFHGAASNDGTAIFRPKLKDEEHDNIVSDADDLDLEHKLMTEEIMANLQSMDDTDAFDSGTVVFSKDTKKPTSKKPRDGRKSTGGGRRRISNVSETRGRVSDVSCAAAPSPEEDARSTEGSASADTSGSEDAESLTLKKDEKPKKKKKSKGEEGEDGKKAKRKPKRRSSIHLLPSQEFSSGVLETWTMEQLEMECSQLETQRELEVAKVNIRFEEKRKLLEQAISIRRLEEGATK